MESSLPRGCRGTAGGNLKGLRNSRPRAQTSTNSKWEPGEKVADLFSSLPPSLQAQFLHTVCQENCCVCHMANSGQRGDHSPCVASLLFLLHFLFLLLLLAWAYTPKYNSVRKTSLSYHFIHLLLPHSQGFPGGSVVKNLPANSGNTGGMGLIPGSGRSPGVRSGMHSSTLAWEIPWTEEPGGLPFMGSQRVRPD